MERICHSRMRHWCWTAAAGLLLIIGALGCGVKAPPVPPRHPPLPPVEALTGTLEGGTVTLTWRHDPAARGVAGYVVLRSQAAPDQPPCPGCPLIYQRAGTVRVDRATQNVTFTEQVPHGFKYTYKVRAEGTGGAQGPDKATFVLDRSREDVE